MALSLALNGFGLDYGLPNIYTWAQDEIIPAEVLEGVQQRFAGGWHSRYPPLHYGLMALAYAPVLLVSPPVAVAYDSETYERLFLAGRLLSLLLATGTLLLVHACAAEAFGARSGAFAALCLALSPTFAYYARFANLDGPYLFWFACSLLLLLRFLRTRGLRHACLSAVAAALAIGTKDQAYALYVLPAIFGVILISRDRRGQGQSAGPGATLRDPRVVRPLLLASVVLALAYNALLNPTGFAEHVRLIVGDASRDYRMFAANPAGQLSLLALCARLLGFVLGAPTALLAAAGVLIAWRAKERRLLSTLLPVLSFQLLFLAVVGYAYDRFLLPHALVLALFAGRAFHGALSWGGPGLWLRRLAVASVLAFGLLRVVSLDLLLTHDSRYLVESWFRDNVRADARVALLGPLEYLPRPGGPEWKQRTELIRALEGMRPDCVVVNVDFAQRAEDLRARDLYAGLASAQLGYVIGYSGRASIRWPFRLDEYVRRLGPSLPTNLDKINPEIRVYTRTP